MPKGIHDLPLNYGQTYGHEMQFNMHAPPGVDGQKYIPWGKGFMIDLVNEASFNSIPHLTRRHELVDKTVIVCTLSYGVQRVDIYPVISEGESSTKSLIGRFYDNALYSSGYYTDEEDEGFISKHTIWGGSKNDSIIGKSVALKEYGGVDWASADGETILTYGNPEFAYRYQLLQTYSITNRSIYSKGVKIAHHSGSIIGAAKLGEFLIIVTHLKYSSEIVVRYTTFPSEGDDAYELAWKVAGTYDRTGKNYWSFFNFNPEGDEAVATMVVPSDDEAQTSYCLVTALNLSGESISASFDDSKTYSGITVSYDYTEGDSTAEQTITEECVLGTCTPDAGDYTEEIGGSVGCCSGEVITVPTTSFTRCTGTGAFYRHENTCTTTADLELLSAQGEILAAVDYRDGRKVYAVDKADSWERRRAANIFHAITVTTAGCGGDYGGDITTTFTGFYDSYKPEALNGIHIYEGTSDEIIIPTPSTYEMPGKITWNLEYDFAEMSPSGSVILTTPPTGTVKGVHYKHWETRIWFMDLRYGHVGYSKIFTSDILENPKDPILNASSSAVAIDTIHRRAGDVDQHIIIQSNEKEHWESQDISGVGSFYVACTSPIYNGRLMDRTETYGKTKCYWHTAGALAAGPDGSCLYRADRYDYYVYDPEYRGYLYSTGLFDSKGDKYNPYTVSDINHTYGVVNPDDVAYKSRIMNLSVI